MRMVGDVNAVEIEDLVVVRGGVRVLDSVSLSVRVGSVTGLLGPSGAGKTTLMRAIVGVQGGTRGSVRVLGHPGGHPSLRSHIGYLTQTPAVYGDLSVVENLQYFSAVAGAASGRVGEVLDSVAMTRYADRLVARLSGGERVRVSLAAALIAQPRLLVLDEPTVGLDPVLRRDLWDMFHHLAADGVTLLVSSHVMDEARRCTDLLLMRDGRLLASGTPDTVGGREPGEDLEDLFCRLVDAPAALAGGAS